MGQTKAVITFGRFNPPTIGHRAVIDTMVEAAKAATDAQTAAVSIYVIPSRTQDAKKNPLSVDFKEQVLSQVTDANIHVGLDKEPRTIIEAAAALSDKGFDELIVIVGSDRVTEFQDLLDKYNGQETKQGIIPYEFDNIQVIQAGDPRTGEAQLDPDSDVSAVSASAARDYAAKNDFDSFRQIFIDPENKELARKVFKELQNAMGVTPTEEEPEEDALEESLQRVMAIRQSINEDVNSHDMGRDTTLFRINEQGYESNPDEDEEDPLKTPMTKTFVRHGMVDADVCESRDVIDIKDIVFHRNKLAEGKMNMSPDKVINMLAEHTAGVLSFLVHKALKEHKDVILRMHPLPTNMKLAEVSSRRAEVFGKAFRYMPSEYSGYLDIHFTK